MQHKNDLLQRTLLAPARLITGAPITSGYDMGLAATCGSLDFDGDFELGEGATEAVIDAMEAVEQAHRAYFWRLPDDNDSDVMPMRSAAERVREGQMRLTKIRDAVDQGNSALAELRTHGVGLAVTTRPQVFVPLPAGFVRHFPFSALVHVEPLS